MVSSFDKIFSEEELQYILNLPEVLNSKEEINKKTSGSVYFNSALTKNIKTRLTQIFNNDFSNLQTIPMRWIKGDIPPHEDRGANSFQNTYLVYINDNVGELILGDESYPIVAGTGYRFSEGINHETKNTLSEPRLLIGPMSETGFSVGVPSTTLQGDGATDTFYIRQADGVIEYQINSDSWYSIVSLPIYINNTNPNPSSNILKVIFTTNIIIDDINFYFICNSDGIQIGSSSLNNGERVNIDISGVVNYYGLIQNGIVPYNESGSGYNNIYVYNLNVSSSNGSTLNTDLYGGWVCRPFFGRNALNNYIISCSSTGAINDYCGGILGGYAAYCDNASTSTLYIYGCSSSGTIGESAGGIVGSGAATTSDVDPTFTSEIYIEQCYSTGAIGVNAGGIVGSESAYNHGYISVIKSYSTGTIGTGAGGIVGENSGGTEYTVTHLDVNSCYSTGSISEYAGGIYGSSTINATATNCYSTGSINSDSFGGGIFGNSSSGNTATHCYVSGAINYLDGYIFGGVNTVPESCYSEAANESSGWNSTNANTVLTGFPPSDGKIGTSWVATIIDSPYELNNIGYSPYTNENITSAPQLNQSYSQTIQAGQTSIESINADASGNYFSLLAIQNGNPSSYGSITINSQTGLISTTSSTAPATYTLIIRSVGSYNITIFNLIISGDAAAAIASCCEKTLDLKGLDYTTRNELIAGNVIISSTAIQRGPISYAELLARKMAYASKR